MLNILRVAQYARFSSDNQRSESIDAQIRAMNQFCKQNHWNMAMNLKEAEYSAKTVFSVFSPMRNIWVYLCSTSPLQKILTENETAVN